MLPSTDTREPLRTFVFPPELLRVEEAIEEGRLSRSRSRPAINRCRVEILCYAPRDHGGRQAIPLASQTVQAGPRNEGEPPARVWRDEPASRVPLLLLLLEIRLVLQGLHRFLARRRWFLGLARVLAQRRHEY